MSIVWVKAGFPKSSMTVHPLDWRAHRKVPGGFSASRVLTLVAEPRPGSPQGERFVRNWASGSPIAAAVVEGDDANSLAVA